MQLKEIIQKSIDECKNIIFPKVCIHCSSKAVNNFFCLSCMNFFDLVFDKKEIKKQNCKISIFSCFEEIGPVNTFIDEIKKQNMPALVKVAASYILYQMNVFNIKDIDLIVPMKDLSKGHKINEILSKEVSRILKIPLKKMFFETKLAMMQNILFMKKTELKNKRILLVSLKEDEKTIDNYLNILIDAGFTNIYYISIV